jgi:ribosomal-protein-alanine N-acetyltransferase
MSSQPDLRGAKTVLRRWRETDVDFVLSVTADPLIPLISQVPRKPDPAGALAFVDAQTARIEDGRGWAWAVALPETGEVVGYVGALWVARPAGRASIGYWTRAARRRAGTTADAVAAAARWLLAEGGVARLEAYVEPWNAGSARVAEKAGFEREGLMRSFAVIGGERRDALLYARIRPRASSAGQRE